MNTWIDWTYIIISLQVLKNARMWLIPSNSVHSIGGQITGTMVSPTPHPYQSLFTLRPRQNGRHFTDDIFKCIFLYENAWIPISLKFVPKGPINNIPTLVQMMAWRRPGDKPLSGPMMVRLPTHICVTRPQWVKMLHLGMAIQTSFHSLISRIEVMPLFTKKTPSYWYRNPIIKGVWEYMWKL